MNLRTAAAAAIFLSSAVLGCTTQPSMIAVELPLPSPQVYPRIDASELSSLSEETYQKIVKNCKMRDARIKTLESIIRSTHGKAE